MGLTDKIEIEQKHFLYYLFLRTVTSYNDGDQANHSPNCILDSLGFQLGSHLTAPGHLLCIPMYKNYRRPRAYVVHVCTYMPTTCVWCRVIETFAEISSTLCLIK